MSLYDPSDSRPIHFMGIAGAGMSALALVARRRGVDVSGCDIDLRDAADLIQAGVDVRAGHDPRHVSGARAVVHTSAVARSHPELEAAAAGGIPVLKRAEALGALVSGATVIGVAGTHGKTTVTAMATEALAAVGQHPTGIVGGRVDAWGGNARIDGDDVFVVEADEYDRSFLSLDPTVATINNLEADHLECYGSYEALEQAFADFAMRADRVLIGADDRGAVRVASRIGAPSWHVGMRRGADVHVGEINRQATATDAVVTLPDGRRVTLRLVVPGLHNLRNAAMALGVVCALDGDVALASHSLGEFRGVGRRFEVVGVHRGVTVVDDYAHHPSEVIATIAAARQRFPESRIIAVFQPHLFSRTKLHAEAFGVALSTADRSVVTAIYPARETPIPGVTGRLVVEAAESAGSEVEWIEDSGRLVPHLMETIGVGDVVLMLGAGDITVTARNLVDRLAVAAA